MARTKTMPKFWGELPLQSNENPQSYH